MSYQTKFHDYIVDLPMEIGRAFYPPPHIMMPSLELIKIKVKRDEELYDFSAEYEARHDYDNLQNGQTSEPTKESQDKKDGLGTSTVKPETSKDLEKWNTPSSLIGEQSTCSSLSTTIAASVPSSSEISSSVLLPSTVPLMPSAYSLPSTSASQATPLLNSAPKPTIRWEDFEQKASCFDELEWKSIDEKKALEMILQPQTLPQGSSSQAPSTSFLPSSTAQSIIHPTSQTPPSGFPQIPVRNPK